MLATLFRPNRRRHPLAAAAALAALTALLSLPAPAQTGTAAKPTAASATTAPPSEPLCTAHYDQLSRQLARRIAETPENARAPLQAELSNVLRKGAVFVGHAYLDSMSESQGRAELDKAKAELARLAPAERERLAPPCEAMSNKLRKDAPAWQRLVVDKVADRRAERLVKSALEERQRDSAVPATR